MLWTQKKHLDTKLREQLGEASRDYNACLKLDFWPDFLAGKNVNVENHCLAQKSRIDTLQKELGQSSRL